MPKPLLTLKTMTAARDICAEKKLTVLDQRHLGWQVITLEHLDTIPAVAEADIICPPVVTRAKQPEGVQTSPHDWNQSGDFNLRPWEPWGDTDSCT